jgi:hypothetical protein
MAILGGSPLGLIGVFSGTSTGFSGFNGGPSRNVNVSEYNKSQGGSLFSGKRRLRAWPDIRETKSTAYARDEKGKPTNDIEWTEEPDTTGLGTVYKDEKTEKAIDGFKSSFNQAKGSNMLHNNDVYDTSVLNLVEKLAGTRAQLRPTDFAYLKDLGVYPNNRLMVARRFLGPVGDNIMTKMTRGNEKGRFPASAILISWKPEGDDFLEIQFGEEWTAAKADFTGMLNAIGDDFMKGGVGKIASAAGGAVPLPGFTEIFQRKFLAQLGLYEEDAGNQIPAGNPNLIKEAKQRKTVGYSEAGSGLMAKVSIKMICEYELKFISGIDPTIIWMDLLGMILRFGTSESSNYGLSQGVAAKLGRWASNPRLLVRDIMDGIRNAITKASKEITQEIEKVYNAATKAAQELSDEKPGDTSGSAGSSGEKKDTRSDREKAIDLAKEVQRAGKALLQKLVAFAGEAIEGTIIKYRVEMMGIVNALTGNPSTPWHITIGNPLRPIFCSGDMLTTEVNLKLGPTLAFNDLPSTITVEFTLTNARNWGLQEIMAKFNSGYLRTVDVQRSYFETNIQIKKKPDGKSDGLKEEETGSMFGDEKFATTSYKQAVSPDGTPPGTTVSTFIVKNPDGTESVQEYSVNTNATPSQLASLGTPVGGNNSTPVYSLGPTKQEGGAKPNGIQLKTPPPLTPPPK